MKSNNFLEKRIEDFQMISNMTSFFLLLLLVNDQKIDGRLEFILEEKRWWSVINH